MAIKPFLWPDDVEIDTTRHELRVCGQVMPVGMALEGYPSTWFTWLCGENGWWVNVCFDGDDGTVYGYSEEEGEGAYPRTMGLEATMDLWRTTCLRWDAPPTDDDPFGGCNAGEWMGFEQFSPDGSEWTEPPPLTSEQRAFMDMLIANLLETRPPPE